MEGYALLKKEIGSKFMTIIAGVFLGVAMMVILSILD